MDLTWRGLKWCREIGSRATQLEAMQPDKEMRLSGTFTERAGLAHVSQFQQN